MTDIVERLRKQAGWHIDNQKMVTGPLLDEAADEIERMRLNVVGLTASDEAKYDIIQALHGQIEKLRAQVVSLQSSLEVGTKEKK